MNIKERENYSHSDPYFQDDDTIPFDNPVNIKPDVNQNYNNEDDLVDKNNSDNENDLEDINPGANYPADNIDTERDFEDDFKNEDNLDDEEDFQEDDVDDPDDDPDDTDPINPSQF
jgi:hypothetical protein